MTDQVTVFAVTSTPGKALREERLFACVCSIMPAAEQEQTGAQARQQTGETYQVVITPAEWKSELKPAAGTTKIESLAYGVLMVLGVNRLGSSWSLACIGKAVRA
jgi:hypothetical protein